MGFRRIILGLLLSAWPSMLWAETATVAVAANFADVVKELKTDFERGSEHKLRITIGSTGALYAQIRHGAPFDAFLAADQRRPALLEEDGTAVAGSRFTYAIGRLTLWSAEPGYVAGPEILQSGDFARLAMANPRVAPYGLAALQTLEALDVYDRVDTRIIRGENVGQTFAMVAAGGAELGFVSLSYVLSANNRTEGSRWDVPPEYHDPIRQDAVLMERASDNRAARAFLEYLRSPRAAKIIAGRGYASDSPTAG